MDIFDAIIAEINEKIDQLNEEVVRGNMNNFEEYKGICGEIRGLLTARGYVLGFKQRMENEDD